VFLCAVVVRVLYLYDSSNNPTFSAPVVDSLSYDLMAREAVEGAGITRDFFWQQFFYPFFLSIVYFFSNCSIIWAKFVQLLLGSFTCVLIYYLGKKILGHPVGILAGLMAAVYGPLVFFEAELLAAGWAAFWAVVLTLLLLETAEKRSLSLCFALGLCSALSVIARPNFLPFLLASGVWLGAPILRKIAKWGPIATVWVRGESSGKRFAAGALLVSLGFCIVAVPVAAKNYQVTGQFSFLPGTGGLNLYIGNNPDFEAVAVRPGEQWEKIVQLPGSRGLITPNEKQRFFYARTLKYLSEQPISFLRGLIRKGAEFTSSRELPGHVDIYLFRSWSPLLGLLVWKVNEFGFPFGVLLPLALLGLFLCLKKIPLPVLFFLALYPVSVILTHVEARYRIPVIPLMCIVAAAGLMKIAEFVRLRQWLNLTAAGIFCAAAGVVCSIAGPFYSEKHIDYEAELHYVLGGSLRDRGKVAEAVEAYSKAIGIRPGYAEAYRNLGLLLIEQQKLREAIKLYESALGVIPENASLHVGLGVAFFHVGKIDRAIECYHKAIEIDPTKANAYDNLGMAFFRLNRVEEALENYNKAIELNPDDPVTHNSIGGVLAMQGRFREAIKHFEISLRIRPNQALTLSNLASAYASVEEFQKAAEKFKDALRIAPADAVTCFNLGLCLQQQGRINEAVQCFRKVLVLDPGHKRARQALDELARSKH